MNTVIQVCMFRNGYAYFPAGVDQLTQGWIFGDVPDGDNSPNIQRAFNMRTLNEHSLKNEVKIKLH